MTESAELRALLGRVHDEPNVVGLVLTGSVARQGMATSRSDVDVYVVLDGPDPAWGTTRSSTIDIAVCTLDQLRQTPLPGDIGWWDRYSFTHSQVLLDKVRGEVAELVGAWGTLSGAESKVVLETYLDGYLNYAFRSLKSHRDGGVFEARLDAVESLAWMLPVIFAFERRVRPYNKYLAWELIHHPLERVDWQSSELLPRVQTILDTGDASAQRWMFASIESASREVGLGGIVDGWCDELALFRHS
ncbi:MAG: nucleotidyltransferase domain-containing protein [Nocardioidaceae bacterium]